MFNEKENNDILRNALGKEISLPDSLGKDNIVKLIEAENAGKSKKRKGVVRRFVAVGVAACLMITGVSFLLDKGLFSTPESLVEDQNVNNQIAQSTAGNYDELLSFIKAYAKEYKENNKYNMYLYSGLIDEVADDMEDGVKVEASYNTMLQTGTVSGDVSFGSEEAADERNEFGEVNLREYGVKEADIFITDGEYLYCIDTYGRRLRIIKANADGTLDSVYKGKESLIDDRGTGEQLYYSGLYVYKNYLIVGFTRYILDKHYAKSGAAGVLIYDVSDKSAPVLKKEIALDGNYVSSRIIDSSLVLVTRYSIVEQYDTEEATDLIPSVYNGDYKYNVPCDCIVYSREDNPETYVNIGKIDLGNLEKEPVVSSYLGNVNDTYCTSDTLYLIGAKTQNNTHDDAVLVDEAFVGFGGVMIAVSDICTTVTKADISGERVDIKCRAEFEGSILNDYSIDEYNNYLRVAVTTLDNENSILVFDESLGKVGELTGLADGEQIKSARFMGNTAYVVTFVQTDPLFVIDLTDPKNPEIKGEVKLPGFSSYLHPVGDGLLVGIGVGGTETGTDGSSKISLFDVSDPTAPKEIDHLQYPTSHIGTEAKAFCSISEDSFLVTYSNWAMEDFDEEMHYYKHYTGALKVSVQNNKLVLDNAYLLKGGDSTSRATFIRDNVYVFSEGDSGVASFNMKTGEFIDIAEGEDARYTFAASDRPVNEILY